MTWTVFLGTATLLTASGSLWLLPADQALLVCLAASLAFLALVARGMVSIRSSFVEPTLWRSDDARETRVALTFDDGPHPAWTPAVLDELRRRDARATFFVVGENARRHPELVRRIHAEGHELGCHGDSHAWTTPLFGRGRMETEIERCLEAVRAAAGVTPRLYRPPLGFRSPGHTGLAARHDLVVVGMERRGHDPAPTDDAAAFARRFVGAARGGEVLALHDGEEPLHPRSRAGTVAALPAVLDGLAAKGLKAVPASALLAERPYRESSSRGWTGKSRGGRFGMAVFAAGAKTLGRRGCAPIARVVAAWFVLAAPRARRASIDLRRRLHGPGTRAAELAWAARHFGAFAQTLVDRMAFLHGGERAPATELVGYDDVRSVFEGDGGFLFVSAHVGDWIAASRVAQLGGRPLWVVAARGMGVGPHQVARDAGPGLYETIDVDGPPIEVAARIALALRRGGVVAMLGDRRVSGDVVHASFLGKEAAFPSGPWAVAAVTGAPVVVFFMTALPDGSHRLRFFPPIRVVRAPGEGREAAVRAAAERFAGHLEDVVRAQPMQWSNFYDFWEPECSAPAS